MSFNGWMIPDAERARLLALFPPRYPDVRMSHVTHEMDGTDLPCDAEIEIIGYANDSLIEALIVTVNGTRYRPHGGIYHITISSQTGVPAKMSNDMIMRSGWTALSAPISIETRAFARRGDSYVTTPLTSITASVSPSC